MSIIGKLCSPGEQSSLGVTRYDWLYIDNAGNKILETLSEVLGTIFVKFPYPVYVLWHKGEM